MDRTYSVDDRIRRAEEIYARRQNLRERTTRARVNIETPQPKNFKLFKRLFLQIIICILIYYIFYLINTTNYSFSDETLSKAREILSYDFDFQGAYTTVLENINNFLKPEAAEEEENTSTEGNLNQEEINRRRNKRRTKSSAV